MRLSFAASALAAAFVLTHVAAGTGPAWGQDFSITNQIAPTIAGHPDLMPQLQAWWDVHAYYPRHASDNEEGGTVKVHLEILPDGRIWLVNTVGSSGSRSLDTAASSVFAGGSVRPFPPGETQADVDLSLHYVLAYRHGQKVTAGDTPALSKDALKELAAQVQAALKAGDTATAARLSGLLSAGLDGASAAQPVAAALPAAGTAKTRPPFTIINEPVKSPVLTTMLQRTCAGTITLGGVANQPIYGMHLEAKAIFFRKPDGTPWVKFSEKGIVGLSPVTQIGTMVTWTGPTQILMGNNIGGMFWYQYTAWPDGDNRLHGIVGSRIFNNFGVPVNSNLSGTSVDLTCDPQVLPSVTWSNALATSMAVSPVDLSSSDPP